MHNKLPELLRANEGAMVTFYSQGDWGIEKLWFAASCMVSDTAQHNVRLLPTGGKVRVLLVVGILDRTIIELVSQYLRRRWADHITLVCHTTTLAPQALQQHIDAMADGLHLVIGQRAAQQQSLWMRWNDLTYSTLLLHGPIFSRDFGNPPFATYTATFHDQQSPTLADDGTPTFATNHKGKALVEQAMEFWQTL